MATDTAELAALAEPDQSQVAHGRARRTHVWYAAVAYYLFAAIIPEMMSGSTPPLRFIQPFYLLFLPLLYGSSALLIREMVIRRRLGWPNVLLLGAAFGVFQEGLVVQTWYNYAAPSSASHTATSFSVAHGVDWSAAIGFTLFHSIISIAAPLVLIQCLFPRQSPLPWLGRKSATFLSMWLLGPCAAMAFMVATHIFASEGYHGPPEPQYGYTALAVVALVALGSLIRLPALRISTRPAPSVRRVFLTSAGLTLLFFITLLPLGATPLPAVVPLLSTVGVAAWALWRVLTWSARGGWSAAHEFALALGVVAYFAFIMDPLIEFAAHMALSRGITGVSWLIFAFLALVNWRLARQARRAHAAALAAAGPAASEENVGDAEDGAATTEEDEDVEASRAAVEETAG